MTVRALQGVADKLPGIALRVMEDFFAEANRISELILRNFVISRRAERRLGIFAALLETGLSGFAITGSIFFDVSDLSSGFSSDLQLRLGQCGANE